MREGDTKLTKLTKPQFRALRHLASVNWCVPSSLGQAMLTGTETRTHRAQQGYGRVGGAMGTRLAKMGLASHHYCTWPVTGNRYAAGYEITEAGRQALPSES